MIDKNNKKYFPFRDPNFWVAFFFSGGISIFNLIRTKTISDPVVIVSIVFMASWEAWVVYKKGRKGSLIVGLFIAIFMGWITILSLGKIEEKMQKKHTIEVLEKYRNERKIQTTKMLEKYRNEKKYK